jgi:hypothetical protein
VALFVGELSRSDLLIICQSFCLLHLWLWASGQRGSVVYHVHSLVGLAGAGLPNRARAASSAAQCRVCSVAIINWAIRVVLAWRLS